MKNLKFKFCILMMCLLSGCTLKKVYYPAYAGYDIFGRPVTVYDYYYVDLDNPKSARHANPYIIQQPVIIQETVPQQQQPKQNLDCNCK